MRSSRTKSQITSAINNSPMQCLDNNAAFGVYKKVELMTTIHRYLATLLVEVHKEIDILREEVFEEFNWKAMSSMLVSILKVMVGLENTYELQESDYSLVTKGFY